MNDYESGRTLFMPDTRFITEFDQYLFGQGTHYDLYNKLGAHPMTVDEEEGVYFAVWAPNAIRVSVVGNFNNWDGRAYQMNLLESGIYELFIPGVRAGDIYKVRNQGQGRSDVSEIGSVRKCGTAAPKQCKCCV